MRRWAIVCSMGLSFLVSKAAWAEPRAEDGYYQGKLSKQPVVLRIGPDESGTAAEYRYLHYGPVISLGIADGTNGSIVLTEENSGGEFHALAGSGGNLTGTWKSRDGKRSIPFGFKRIADITDYVAREPKFFVDYSVPQFTAGTPFYIAVNKLLARRLKEEMDQVVAEYRTSVQEADNAPFPWENETSVEVIHADDSMASLLFTTYEYCGGAHGNCRYTAKTYVWQDGDLLELKPKDVVSPQSLPVVTEMLIKELQRRQASWPENARKIKLEDEVINPTATGLMFTFGPYDVGSHAEGTYTVVLPYSRLSGVIAAESPVKRLVEEELAGFTETKTEN